MLGRSHLIIGAAGFVVAGTAISEMAGQPMTTGELACGTLIAAGAALLPDLDHPQATVSRSFGPVSKVLSRVINAVAGGHRQGTHSLLGVALATLAAWALTFTGGIWGPFLLAVICVGLVVQVVLESLRPVATLLATLVIAGGLIAITPSFGWLWLAVGVGYALHLAADWVTQEGVPLLWPLPPRQRLGLIRTGGMGERVIAFGCSLLLAWGVASAILIPTYQATHGEESPVAAMVRR